MKKIKKMLLLFIAIGMVIIGTHGYVSADDFEEIPDISVSSPTKP